MSIELNSITNIGPMLNAYPDSMGDNLGEIIEFLQREELKDVFTSFYILPSVFNTDLDRGFSVIDYRLNQELATNDDLEALKKLKIDLKFDFILNHASVLSAQFQDILKNGENSRYKDFFINWNQFWDGYVTMTEVGYIQPNEDLIAEMFFRKAGLPILMVGLPDGTKVPYWNTFYQEIQYPVLDAQDIMKLVPIQYYAAQKLADRINNSLRTGKKPDELNFGRYEEYREKIIKFLDSNVKYLGQMDLNIKSPLVWEFYDNTLKTLAAYGAKIVRLDAFAYAPKEPGEKNFLNDPGTWDLLEKVKKLADQYKLTLLPEIHASYEEGIYKKLSEKGYMTYDFFLP
ncbi:MAG: glycosidase, partial [Clostridiales bacterium]|nr:glycosidase [Clostridiales bacterium]